jgi:hypothetical protein
MASNLSGRNDGADVRAHCLAEWRAFCVYQYRRFSLIEARCCHFLKAALINSIPILLRTISRDDLY